MKVKLNITDRLQFNQVLPTETNYIEMMLVKDIKSKVSISQEEAKKINLETKTVDGKIIFNWEIDKSFDKEIDFTNKEIEVINNKIKELDSKKKITEANFDLIKKIKESK